MQPDVHKKIIAIVGMAGSGKSSVASHLQAMGVPVIRFGQIVVDELKARALQLTPENERVIREDLRRQYGMDAMAKLSLSRINEELKSNSVVAIDGLYSLSEYKMLKGVFGDALLLVALFTSKLERYQRLRMRKERPLSKEEAESRDYFEIENIEKAGPIALADVMVINDGSEESLVSKVDTALKAIVDSGS
jgi:dephospho-CoA kinase